MKASKIQAMPSTQLARIATSFEFWNCLGNCVASFERRIACGIRTKAASKKPTVVNAQNTIPTRTAHTGCDSVDLAFKADAGMGGGEYGLVISKSDNVRVDRTDDRLASV